jgi:hypothetical protein
MEVSIIIDDEDSLYSDDNLLQFHSSNDRLWYKEKN